MAIKLTSSAGEQIVKTFYHHPFKFFLQVVGTAIASLPFFLVATFFSGVIATSTLIAIYATIIGLFTLVIFYEAFVYFKDRLIITSHRIIHVDWKALFKVHETEIALKDVLDISTEEHGILELIPIFDYGTITIETAAEGQGIIFQDATDPEGIKHFIYHLQLKPSKISADNTVINQGFSYDRTYSEKRETTDSSR